MAICLERSADLHRGPADATATHCLLLQENPDWFTFLVPAHPGSPGQRADKRVCVCVCLSSLCCVLFFVISLLSCTKSADVIFIH